MCGTKLIKPVKCVKSKTLFAKFITSLFSLIVLVELQLVFYWKKTMKKYVCISTKII